MALMLAPYNGAMRLGMGFNSYTQTLCVNDVVRKPGNIPATEIDLRAAQLTQKTDAATSESKRITGGTLQHQPQEVLDGASGTISRVVVDGQKEVSQVVSWEASFIENGSEVLKKLDVSGALSIKMAGMGQLSGKAAFVDSTDIKNADIKYLVHVKVTNQRLIADNITEFAPIDHIEPGQFTEIYGDCFISGFIEGGEFDALVTVTTEETIKKNSLSGGLELGANISGFDVSGAVDGGVENNSNDKKARTKISVTWSGGGDIRNDNIKEWTLESLKAVAMSFPDAARNDAVLTKYTSLRSYHEQTRKGSPLDYENAGVYTAALYDAYTDYKMMWGQIHTMIGGFNRNEIRLFTREALTIPKDFDEDMKKDQENKERHYNERVKAREEAENAAALAPYTLNKTRDDKPIEKPLPINKFEPYKADIFGLEKAAHDCRFEMIKIVRETLKEEPLPTYEEWKATKDDLVIQKNDVRSKQDSINELKKELETTKDNLKNQKNDVNSKEEKINELKKKLEAALVTPRKANDSQLDDRLPLQYDKAIVMFMNIASQLALDAGRDGFKAHGFEYDLTYDKQKFRLEKVYSSSTKDDTWTIARVDDNQRLYFDKTVTEHQFRVGSSPPDMQDHWYIVRGSASRAGSWVLKNAESNTCIELKDNSRWNGHDGVPIVPGGPSDDRDTANWVIIVREMAS
ncbi:hypothetical protein NOF04DRAFT_18301 [Fusarium oxysporum II5]|uniref:Jacalin-type lectin domain-containing protein n=1 Tax=Fusarium odoratissimum (strain NRRL 54006) TaxID=1089451 RepID=X0J3W4_FUSO5|nr:uncharacterized protein FOIG_15790 [Fusarium odoratissimum NRRL 54006]EXL90985.1 hypothetical protein FOIG_15790 [Fusarium odoratissimum NRRL 54006]KAK2126413.1 hypothetical protein NOF04DRAFT_18301 [Fusarium oxysporum II5]